MESFSLDQELLADRKSTYLVRIRGKRKRAGLVPGDLLVVDRKLPFTPEKLAVVVLKGKFSVEVLTPEFIQRHDPENGDFIWGMIRAVVRELK